MNWLERARREILENAQPSTANSAVRSPEIQESGLGRTANTAVGNLTAVTAVPAPGFYEKHERAEEGSFDRLPELPATPEAPETPSSGTANATLSVSGSAAPSGPSSPVPGVPWPTSAADWLTYYADRITVAEVTTKLSRPLAEERAYRAALAQWVDLNSTASDAKDGCVVCSAMDRSGDDLLPVGIGTGEERVWLHRDCVPAWRAARLAEAARVLASMGITSKGSAA